MAGEEEADILGGRLLLDACAACFSRDLSFCISVAFQHQASAIFVDRCFAESLIAYVAEAN